MWFLQYSVSILIYSITLHHCGQYPNFIHILLIVWIFSKYTSYWTFLSKHGNLENAFHNHCIVSLSGWFHAVSGLNWQDLGKIQLEKLKVKILEHSDLVITLHRVLSSELFMSQTLYHALNSMIKVGMSTMQRLIWIESWENLSGYNLPFNFEYIPLSEAVCLCVLSVDGLHRMRDTELKRAPVKNLK